MVFMEAFTEIEIEMWGTFLAHYVMVCEFQEA